MFVGLIARLSIDRADLAFSGKAFLQMVFDVMFSEPTFGASGDRERAGHGDEQQNALHPLILGSARSIARMTIGRQTANLFS
jgi:hypothetical protein